MIKKLGKVRGRDVIDMKRTRSCLSMNCCERMILQYDVFLSYSHSEAGWVETELWPELESPSSSSSPSPSFTCCVHTRDFLPGLPIPEQIISNMKVSRATVIVLSSTYCRQHWTRLEWRQALRQSEQDRTKVTSHLSRHHYHHLYHHLQRLIILLHGLISRDDIEDRELWNYIVNKNYIDTNDSNFWVKLR